MKRNPILTGLLAAASLVLILAGSAEPTTVSDYPAGAIANGIAGSRHNMGSFGTYISANYTTEICVFCHTPHHTNTAVSPAPLWNRVNAAPSYTAYGTTLGGNPVTAVGSVSLACLSCHDGVTSFDSIVNVPGAGGVDSSGPDRGWRFRMPTGGFLTSTIHTFSTTAGSGCIVCHETLYGYAESPARRLNIGSDLSNDHPVSVEYLSDRASLRPTSSVISQIDLTAGLQPSAMTAYGGNLAQNRWAIKGSISDTATIADLLRNGKVECSSCHDPHFKNLSWDAVENRATGYWDNTNTWNPYAWCAGEQCTDGQFLRRVGGNTGSGVCRTCHNK